MFEFLGAFVTSCYYAVQGILFAGVSQRNFRIHLVAGVLVLAAGWWLNFSRLEMVVLILTVSMVISGELLNTALELVLNLLEARDHPVARAAKDVAAGAVFIAVIGSVGVAVFLFGPKLAALARHLR